MGNPLTYIDSTGLIPGDQWFGYNDKGFRDWVHAEKQAEGRRGDQNYTKEELDKFWKQWKEDGCPRGKGGKSGRGGGNGNQRGYTSTHFMGSVARSNFIVGIITFSPPAGAGEDEAMQRIRDAEDAQAKKDCDCKM
jgi:hypothetical protein